jgi:hypothetical protein
MSGYSVFITVRRKVMAYKKPIKLTLCAVAPMLQEMGKCTVEEGWPIWETLYNSVM